jgi:putative transcriptional regulator
MIQVQATDLLIAPPGMPDPRFRDSVLMITHEHHAAAFALCVNRPTQHTLEDVLSNSDLDLVNPPPLPVYWGGPVSPHSLWMVHSTDWSTEDTVAISSAWAMTSSASMFHCLADGDTPKHFRIVMGYCSWAQGQLSAELNGLGPWTKHTSWLVAQNLGPEWLLEQDTQDLWSSATTLCSHQAVDSWL